MGGGGDDGGAAQRQAETEAKKTAARNQLNVLFGVTPTGSTVYTPNSIDSDGASLGMKDPSQVDASQEALDETTKNRLARENLYSDIRDNAFNAGKRGLDETRDVANRKNKFALYAQGLNGGSVDVDENALLGRTYNQGLLDLGSKADSAKSDFKTGDEATRLQLLQSIDAGMDQSSAISSAINQLQNNSERATAQAQGTSLGDLFATSGALYTQSQAAKGKQAATDWWNNSNSSGTGRNNGQNTGYTSSTY